MKVHFIEPLDKPDPVEPEIVSDADEAGQPSAAVPEPVEGTEPVETPETNEGPLDIMPETPNVILSEAKDLDSKDIPDIDDLPAEGDFFEPTLF